MQIDQPGCKTGSMGCIDNLLIDKTVLEGPNLLEKTYRARG